MSDFSDTYHLRTPHVEDAVALLRRAGLSGFVMRENAEWVLILPAGDLFIPNLKLIESNEGELLHVMVAEDHGWGFERYQGRQDTLGYVCRWDPDITIERAIEYRALIEHYPSFSSRYTQAQLTRIFEPESRDTVEDICPADVCAEAMGLKYFHWLRYDQFCSDIRSGTADLPAGWISVEA